jgi:hypothetical protein
VDLLAREIFAPSLVSLSVVGDVSGAREAYRAIGGEEA